MMPPKFVHVCAYRHVDIVHGYHLPPTPLWLGTPVKVAGNGSGAKKTAVDTVPG